MSNKTNQQTLLYAVRTCGTQEFAAKAGDNLAKSPHTPSYPVSSHLLLTLGFLILASKLEDHQLILQPLPSSLHLYTRLCLH